MPLEKNKTGLILLGAKEFPNSEHFTGSGAFYNANEKIKKYFIDNYDLVYSEDITRTDILNLFNTEKDPNEIDQVIRQFIQLNSRKEDLVVHYVGHGGFDNTVGFLLAIKKSRDENLGVSSITSKSLGKTLSKIANHLRLYIILDCCFSAAFFDSIQAPIIDLVKKDVEDNFPQNGIALLCATSKSRPAMIIRAGAITMFSEGLEMALTKGSTKIENEFLTLRDIGNVTYSYIKDSNPGEAIKPEVHSPKMQNGDIADAPFVKNYSFDIPQGLINAFDINKRQKDIAECVRLNNVLDLSKLFMDFVADFDKKKKYRTIEPRISAICNRLENERFPVDSPGYIQYLKDRDDLYERILTIVFDILDNQ